MAPSLRRGLRLLSVAAAGCVVVAVLWLLGGSLPSEPARWLWWAALLVSGLATLLALAVGVVLVVVGLLAPRPRGR